MNVLIACEESQAVCIAFREKGHNAFSCDIQACSGGHPEWHIMQDVLPLLNGNCVFATCDGIEHKISTEWDLIIAFPPCTYLTVTGNRWFNVEKYGVNALQRFVSREKAVSFFLAIAGARCSKVVIENPIGVMSSVFRKPDQIIHPWQFAFSDDEHVVKSTCLWLKGVSPLVPIHDVKPDIKYFEWVSSSGRVKRQSLWYYNTRCSRHSDRSKIASKTFPGVAFAMADQWG